LFNCALNCNVKNPDLFIHGLFKGVLLTAQVIQLRIKGEGYVCYSTTLLNFTGHSAANKVITYQESVIRTLLLVTNQLLGVHSVEWDDFELGVGKDLEESVRRLFFNYPSWRSPGWSKEEKAHHKQNINNAVVSRNGRFLFTSQLYWRFLETAD